MSTFNDEQLISALVDDELTLPERQRAQSIIRDSAEAERRYRTLMSLSRHMREQTVPGLEESADRVRRRLEYSLRGRKRATGSRNRSISLPIPIAAAAAAVVVTLFALTLGGFQETGGAMPAVASSGSAVDLRIQVDGQQTQDLLKWLDQQQTVDAVTIELPESAQFSFMGEPVMMRARDRQEPQIVPFDPDASEEPGESDADLEDSVE